MKEFSLYRVSCLFVRNSLNSVVKLFVGCSKPKDEIAENVAPFVSLPVVSGLLPRTV